jgi:hypothetical protein
VIVHDLYVRRSRRSVQPFEANPPLIVNTDAVLALAVADQYFEAVPWQGGEIAERCSRFHTIKLEARGPFKARKHLYAFTGGEVLGSLVPIADYQLVLRCSMRNSWNAANRGGRISVPVVVPKPSVSTLQCASPLEE